MKPLQKMNVRVLYNISTTAASLYIIIASMLLPITVDYIVIQVIPNKNNISKFIL